MLPAVIRGERTGRRMVAQFPKFPVLGDAVINLGDAVIQKPVSHLNSNLLAGIGISYCLEMGMLYS